VQYNALLSRYIKLKDKLETTETKLVGQVKINKDLEEKNSVLQRNLGGERNKNTELERRVEELMRRIEVLGERQHPDRGGQDKLRRALAELNKENEELRRSLFVKTKDVASLMGVKEELEKKVARLNTKLGIEKQKHYNKINEIEMEYARLYASYDAKKQHISEFHAIPIEIAGETLQVRRSLEFRMKALDVNESNLLADIIDNGAKKFTEQFHRLDDAVERANVLKFVVEQLCSTYAFAENSVYVMGFLKNIVKSNERKVMMLHCAVELPKLFNARRVLLWLKENVCLLPVPCLMSSMVDDGVPAHS
jgi:chromosome segregation ATPase